MNPTLADLVSTAGGIAETDTIEAALCWLGVHAWMGGHAEGHDKAFKDLWVEVERWTSRSRDEGQA